MLDFSQVPKLDVSAARAIETIATDAKQGGRKLFVCGAGAGVKDVLTALVPSSLLGEDAFFHSRLDALEAISARHGHQSPDESVDVPAFAAK